MVNYNNSKIYKIVPNVDGVDEGDIYIGSTTKTRLSERMSGHRDNYKQWKDGKCNKTMSFDLFEKYGIENCSIVLLEEVNCESKDQLHKKERFYIESILCINKNIPSRTPKEYKAHNKDKIKEYQKDWRIENKDKIKETMKEYREQNKEKAKVYREDNKDNLNQIYNCVCRLCFQIRERSRHEKSTNI